MTPYKPFLVSWFILFSTLSVAAPKSKLGKQAHPGKPIAAASRQTFQKKFKPNSTSSAEPTDEVSVDSILYKAQKMAGEWTQEVGYLLKSTGPWLKEIEGMIRGEDTAASNVTATVPAKGPKPVTTATVPASPAPQKSLRAGRPAPKRQLGQMSSNPNSILETVMSVSKETWEKVHAVVADLMGQAKSMVD